MSLVPVDASSALAVTNYLTQARDWLSTAVDQSTPLAIANAKAEIATAAEATKQLGLSKEIQLDATEMVRRAEFALAKSIRKGQDEGTVSTRADNPGPRREYERNGYTVQPSENVHDETKVSVDSLIGGGGRTRHEVLALADVADIDAAIEEAKAEGNLSRANVARKAGTTPVPQRRKPLTDSARDAGWELRKAIERLQRIAADDRFTANKEQMAPHLRSHLENAVEVCQDLLARIN